MNLFRPDLILQGIHEKLGPEWLLVAIAALLYVMFGRLIRSTITAISILICTQMWWRPLYVASRDLRWLALMILVVRTMLFVRKARAAPGEGRVARSLAAALGLLALVSTAWSDVPNLSFPIAVSFCLGLVVTFVLVWRLADGPHVMESFAQGALVLSLALFGAGFAVAGVAYATGAWDLFDRTHLDVTERYAGLFYNANAAGLIGTMLLPILVAAPRATLGRLSWLRLPACALTAATIFLSGSRSAVIGAILCVLVVALYRFGAAAIVTFALGAVVVAVLAVYAPVADWDESAVGRISRTKHLSTLSGRVELWEAGWEDAQGHLVIGQGWNHSRGIGGELDAEQVLETGSVLNATNLHNAHLQLLLDVGIVGVAIFWWFCLCILKAGWHILRGPRDMANAVGVVVFTSVLALLADTWVHGSIWSMGSPTTLAFWGLCALTLKQGDRARMATRERRDAAYLPPPIFPAHVVSTA
jgi:O-antigen ligase